jgi:hypothetical protein
VPGVWDVSRLQDIGEDAAKSGLLAFLTARTEFVLARADGRIERILLVRPGSNAEAATPLIPPYRSTREEEPLALPPLLTKDLSPGGEAGFDGLGV